MFVVFRVLNNDYAHKEVLALCSDLHIAEDFVERMVSDVPFCDCAMYIVGTVADL